MAANDTIILVLKYQLLIPRLGMCVVYMHWQEELMTEHGGRVKLPANIFKDGTVMVRCMLILLIL